MADNFALLADRQMVLGVAGIELVGVFAIELVLPVANRFHLTKKICCLVGVEALIFSLKKGGLLASSVNEKLRQSKITFLPGCSVEPNQRQFYPLMPRNA